MREPAAVEPTLEIGNEGKAARRLELFETARGVESTNVAPKQRTRRSRGESAPPDADLAATYAEVATEIASPPDRAAPAPGGGLDPPTPTGAPQWRSLGPWTIPNGQTYGPEPGQRLRAGRRDRGRPRQRAQHVLVRRGERRRLGEPRPRRELGAAHRLRSHADGRRDRLRPGDPATVYCGHRRGQLVVCAWARACCARRTAAPPGRRCARAPFVGQGFFDLVVDPLERPAPARRDHRRPLRDRPTAGATWTQRRAQATLVRSRCTPGGRRPRSSRPAPTASSARPTAARPGRPSRCPVRPAPFDAARGRHRAVATRASPTPVRARAPTQGLPVAARAAGTWTAVGAARRA